MPLRRAFVSALVVGAAIGVSAPAAGASTGPVPQFAFPTAGFSAPTFGLPAGGSGNVLGACGASTGPQGNGATGGTAVQVCQAPGALSYVAPAVGQISSIVGPTIIGPAVGVSVIQSAGSVGGG
jgi:hypothetical protein